MRNALLITLAMGLAVLFPSPDAPAATFQRQVAQNNSGDKPANDLHITFGWPVWGAKAKPAVQPPGQDADGAVSVDGRTVDFAAPLIGSVAAGGNVYVDFNNLLNSVEYNYIVSEQSYFTQDGTPLTGLTLTGPAMYITSDVYYGETEKKLVVRNQTANQYWVSDLKLYKNNSLTNFNLDDYYLPTGELVTTAPGFMLMPAQEVQIPFGPSLMGTYALAGGDFYLEGGSPAEPMRLYAAMDVVPEPSMLGLSIVGTLALIRRRRIEET